MTKLTFVNGINTVIDKVLSSKNKVYFKILDMTETKEMITILSVAMYSSLTTVLQIWVNKEFHEDFFHSTIENSYD